MLSKTIIDFKPVSPKHGDLFKGRDPVDVAIALEDKGIFALSVVTEREHFGGSVDLLRDIACTVSLPVMRKDFIKSEDMLYETREYGARWVLLICSYINDRELLGALHEKALSIGIEPVVEVHTAQEMEQAVFIGAKKVGINNKDISNLEMDDGTISTTLELINKAPRGAFVISQSGISSREDALRVINAGAHAVLVGTAFWQGDFVV